MQIIECTNDTTKRSYTTKETAEAIRAALKAAFPAVKFSVRTSYASMTSSTSVRWTDGPTTAEVEHVTDRFTSRGFDGMTDSTTYHTQDVDGVRISYSGWVHVTRLISAALMKKAVERFNFIRADYGLPLVSVDVVDDGFGAHVAGRDINVDAGVSSLGYKYHFRFVSDAVESIAHQMRSNGCIVRMK